MNKKTLRDFYFIKYDLEYMLIQNSLFAMPYINAETGRP